MPYITVNDHRINYYDTKDASPEQGKGSPPVIMIHGLGSSQNYYMSVLPEIRENRCIAMDTYGAARSKSNGEKLTLEQLAADVIGLMDELNVPKAVVAGHSMGGTMACTVAAAHPDRVAGIVCIGPVNPKSVKPEMFTQRIETVMKDGMEPLANTIPTSATNAKSTALQRSIIRELIIGQDPKAYASHCQVIVDAKEPDLPSIRIPALILAGDEDKSAPMEGCEYIHQHLGSSKKELKVMQGVGHWHCVEAGDLVGQEIAAFCRSL